MADDDYETYTDVLGGDSQLIYGNQDTIMMDELLRTGRTIGEVCQGYHSQPHTAYSDSQAPGYYNDDYEYEDGSDFSDDDLDDDHMTEEQPPQVYPPQAQPPQIQARMVPPPQAQRSQMPVPQGQPLPGQRPQLSTPQDKNGQDCRSPIRPPQPSPRNQQRQDDPVDDIYLTPLEPLPKPDTSSLPRRPRGPPMQPPSKSVPWNSGRPDNRNQSSKPAGKRGAAPFPPLTSPNKMPPGAPTPSLPSSQSRVPNRTPLPGNSNSQNVAAGSGGGRGSFLHGNQRSNPGTFANKPWNREPAKLPTDAQEEDDHVYEIMNQEVPHFEFQASGAPASNVPDWKPSARPSGPPSWNQNQDFDGLSRQLGPISLNKPPPTLPGLCRKRSDEGNDTGRMSSPTSDSPKQTLRNRPPKPIPQESQAPREFAPSLPTENQPHVKLDDGETILLTPLYQKIMDKPYVHMISRPKAKALIANGDDGMFLVRPSTRTGNPLTLTLKEDGRPYNINIRLRPDQRFALGVAKSQEQTFTSIDEMINTYKREPIKLKNGKTSFLKYTPPKQGSIYVKHHPVGRGKN